MSDRLISADHLRAWIVARWLENPTVSYPLSGKQILDQIDREIEFNPIDVVEVVRCNNCRHNYANLIPNGEGCALNVELQINPEWFCADGAREDEVTE